MNKLIAALIFILLLTSCNAQRLEKKDIIGKWVMSKAILYGKPIFDRHDTSVSIKLYFDTDFEGSSIRTKKDSIFTINTAKESFRTNSDDLYFFTSDSVFVTGIERRVIKGTYSFNFEQQEVICNIDYFSEGHPYPMIFKIERCMLVIVGPDRKKTDLIYELEKLD